MYGRRSYPFSSFARSAKVQLAVCYVRVMFIFISFERRKIGNNGEKFNPSYIRPNHIEIGLLPYTKQNTKPVLLRTSGSVANNTQYRYIATHFVCLDGCKIPKLEINNVLSYMTFS